MLKYLASMTTLVAVLGLGTALSVPAATSAKTCVVVAKLSISDGGRNLKYVNITRNKVPTEKGTTWVIHAKVRDRTLRLVPKGAVIEVLMGDGTSRFPKMTIQRDRTGASWRGTFTERVGVGAIVRASRCVSTH